ncbi:hypothetical protein EB809_16960 [Marinobacter sp. R17]|uniref:hypothetical protein n=1 Tax=Marinobacter TaxID=2742 RepID=UPI000F4C6609|nr:MULTISPECIES: hypothetical protein [Marinobacter]ROT96244.1 hypothetical protein EB809_16960 [Marinobacter sp. R17]
MSQHEHYIAKLAEGSVIPTFQCGHCGSILPKGRIFPNDGDNRQNLACHTIGLCAADDCGAVNSMDDAIRQLEQQNQDQQAAG